VNFTGTRDITSQLTLQVEGGNPPDVAIPAEIGLFQEFARNGRLTPLSACEGLEDLIRDKYPESFVELGTVDGELYGFFMKADSKATIFYNPQLFEDNGWDVPDGESSWDDLISLSEEIRDSGTVPPWSIGMEEAAGTGFPGTDWIQQILLNEHGGEVYDAIVSGETPFTSDEMKDSWEKFGEIALGEGFTAQGSAAAINATNFRDALFVPFEDPPGAAMSYLGAFGAGFITQQFPSIEPGTGFDFTTFPGGDVTGAANIAYAFNDDPTTCSFLEHLAGAEAQQVWVELGGFTSVNEDVDLEAYPSDVAKRLAEQLLEAETFRFDLDDAIGGGLQQAYFQGVTQFLQNPGQLDQILQQIEAAR
jgi:alpha-glucoside transport system substrate-binding protein